MITLIGNGGHAVVVRDVMRSSHRNYSDEEYYFIAVGDNAARKREAQQNTDKTFTTLIHPSTVIAPDVIIGHGTIVMANVVIQPGARIGKHVILNTACTVDHHCIVHDYAHLAPGVHLCGGVEVGEGVLLGVGSCAVPQARIEPWKLVKAAEVAK